MAKPPLPPPKLMGFACGGDNHTAVADYPPDTPATLDRIRQRQHVAALLDLLEALEQRADGLDGLSVYVMVPKRYYGRVVWMNATNHSLGDFFDLLRESK